MSHFKVVITDFGSPDNELEEAELRASGLDYELVRLNARTAEELAPHVQDAHALIVQWASISRPVIDILQNCRVISRYGIGVDMIDLEAATERGIPVCNVPDFCIDEVSTHTLAFVLALNRHLFEHHLHVISGKWGGPPGGAPQRLSRQSLGLLGLGKIGSEVARKAKGVGLRVLAHDPYLKLEQAEKLGVELVSLDDLLRQSDYLSIHCPLTKETRHLIRLEQLRRMKPSAYLINMARGPVVDQAGLYSALTGGLIAGAAMDVLEQEPPLPDDPLLKLPNVLFTPHTSSWSAESIIQLRRDVALNVVQVLRGDPPRAVVNPLVLQRMEANRQRAL
jgi:D-3-phosphoglycerate dehydrogenase / 2-oxoglutarate reductase